MNIEFSSFTNRRFSYQSIPDEEDRSDTTTDIPSDQETGPQIVHIESPPQITDKDAETQRGKRILISAALIFSLACSLLLLVFHADLSLPTASMGVPPPSSNPTSVFSKTTPYRSIVHPDPPTDLWGNVQRPYPTGAFWTNFAIKEGNKAVGVYPYGVKTLPEGIQISYGAFRRRVSDIAIVDPFDVDLQIAAKEAYVSRAVESYDNISVTMSYQTANNGQFKAHLVKASPFITVVYSGATPLVTSPLIKIVSVEARKPSNESTLNLKGSAYVLTLGNYQRWLIYCSEADSLTWDDTSGSLVGKSPLNGFIRMAVLPVNSFEQSLQSLLPFVSKYPKGGIVTFSYPTPTTAIMNIQYLTEGDGPLLMFALPHHIPLLSGVGTTSSDEMKALQTSYSTIFCIKGKLTPVIGDTWKLTYVLPNVGWNYGLMDRLSTAQLDEIAMSLIAEVRQVPPTGVDPYSFGKEMGRMARLALIADNLGIADARQEAIYRLETSIIPWLQGMNHDILLYDQSYGGLVTTYGIADPGNDFGQGWYSDHHFHFGYFANVVAVLAKLDFPFYEANKAALDAFLRDICNSDSTDTDYPFARHKDLFDGHSWASGLFPQGNGKGQESSSEAVNAYYGCTLYGMALGNADYQKFASLLLAMEIQATQFYWHMKSDDIYDASFAANRMVGNIGALDVTASTWFGDAVEYVHGINMMPLSPVTSLLFDVNCVKVQYPVLAGALKNPVIGPVSSQCIDNPACRALELFGYCCPTLEGIMLGCCKANETQDMSNEWRSYIYVDLAVIDRDTAWSQLLRMDDFGVGNSRANSLYWTATRSPTIPGYNISQRPPEVVIKSACSANSARVATGVQGQCCPTENGLYLGCCPYKDKK